MSGSNLDQLAERVGIDPDRLVDIFYENAGPPSRQEALRLAGAFSIDKDIMLEKIGFLPPREPAWPIRKGFAVWLNHGDRRGWGHWSDDFETLQEWTEKAENEDGSGNGAFIVNLDDKLSDYFYHAGKGKWERYPYPLLTSA